MKSLVSGCAAAALLMGLAAQGHAEVAVRDAPVHAVPVDEDDAPAANVPAVEKAVIAAPAPAPILTKVEPAPVAALTQPKAPPAPALTPEEDAFFAALGQRVTDAASAYENYVRRAGAIDPAFSGAPSVQRAVKLGAAYHPHQLEEGIVAYAALIALRNPEFVDGVRAIQNPAFADSLADHPEQVMQVRGAGAAAGDVAGVLRVQGETLMAAGKAVTKAAYDIQAQGWSKSPVEDPKGVLDGAKTSADEMRIATAPSKAKLLDSLVAAPQSPGPQAAEATPATPEVVRGVALAALAILGKTGDGKDTQYEALLDDPATAQCLKMAKLNLNQCLAVAGPNYEDVYCAGRHAVSDTGKCITAAAGETGPALDAAPQPKLEVADAVGPEQAEAYGKAAPKGADEDDDDDDAPATPAPLIAAAPTQAPAQVIAAAPSPAPALQPAPAPEPRQYAEAPALRAEPMPDPRAPRNLQPAPAPAYAPPQPYSYAQNAYAQNTYAAPAPPAPYQRPAYQAYAQPQYQQPYPQAQYAPPQQPYQQPYAPQPYAQPQAPYAPNYGAQQPYYPQQPTYPAYQGNYYGR